MEGPCPEPAGPAIEAWTQRLAGADHSEVGQLIVLAVTDSNGVFPRLHEFLEAAADKLQQAGAHETAASMTSFVNRLGKIDEDLHDAAVAAWGEIDTAQRRRQAATGASPAVGPRPAPGASSPAPSSPPPPPEHRPRTR